MAKARQPAPTVNPKATDPISDQPAAPHHHRLAPAEEARRIMQFLKTSDTRLSDWRGNKRELTRQMKVLQRVVGKEQATAAMNAYLQRQQDKDEDELQLRAAPETVQRQTPEGQQPLKGQVAPLQREGMANGRENRTGMPDQLKAGLEQLSGFDLSDIRVHYDSPKPAEVDAIAYAQGQDIHLAPGQEQHLPHEGWHAVQQMQGRVRPTTQMHGVAINDDERLEREADEMGAKAAKHQRAKSTAPEPIAYSARGYLR